MNYTNSHTVKVFDSEFGGKYYIVNGIAYDIHFPLEWVISDHCEGDGDNVCMNCLYYGSYRGVFIGYCIDCARYHNYERGNGLIDRFVESDFVEIENHTSDDGIWNTYLKGVNPFTIGDTSNHLSCIPEYKYPEIQLGIDSIQPIDWFHKEGLYTYEYLHQTDNAEADTDEDSVYELEYHDSYYDGDNEITDEEYSNLCRRTAVKYSTHLKTE
jgi:hypothetical protein